MPTICLSALMPPRELNQSKRLSNKGKLPGRRVFFPILVSIVRYAVARAYVFITSGLSIMGHV